MAIHLNTLFNDHELSIQEINSVLKLEGISPDEKKELKSLLFNTKFNQKLVQRDIRSNSKGASGSTLSEIASIFGLTRERIRQIEDRAIKQIKHPKVARTLRQYLYEI